MRSLVLKLKDQPFAVVGFNMNAGETKDLVALMEKSDLPWRTFIFESEPARQWRPFTPTFYALDAEGVIRNKWAGGVGGATMDAALNKLLAQAAKAPRSR